MNKEPKILDYQVEKCPTCGSPLEQVYGLAGGGIGPYGFCVRCDRVVWKCLDTSDEA